MQATIKRDELHQGEAAIPEQTATPPPEQENTPHAAIARIEEPVLEGEVTAVIPPEQQPTAKRPPYYLLIVCTILACLLFVSITQLLPLLTPTATVLILPKDWNIAITQAVHIQGRVLPGLTLTQSQTTRTTGIGHQNPTQAKGYVTFYNASPIPQTIDAGELLLTQSGVHIVTDEAASIPGANPPTDGIATVLAHAVNTGSSGNIAAGDINGECCKDYVLVRNNGAFTGGLNARDFPMVTPADIDTPARTIQATLLKSEQAALHAQVNPGEGLIIPPCNQDIYSNHRPGDEATEITVTVSETCSGIAYNAQALHQKATQMITQEALKRFGTGYSLFGDIHMSILHATIIDHTQGIATLSLKIEATYIYQISPGEKEKLSTLLAGKLKAQAINILLQFPGIQAASIQLTGNNTALPDDPHHIHIIVMYRSS